MKINPSPTTASEDLVQRVSAVGFPTMGHFLEEGFLDPEVRAMVPGTRIVGRAVTVRIAAGDSTLVHHVTQMLQPGDVMVMDTTGDRRQAAVGEMVARASAHRGCVGIVIDGVCTDVPELRELQFPVFARGASALTTKLRGLDIGAINEPVVCGGVTVSPGDIVCADDSGVVILSPEVLSKVLPRAEASDENSVRIVARLAAGENLGDISIANKLVGQLLHEERSA